MPDRPTIRFRLWVNTRPIYDAPLSAEDAKFAADAAVKLLRPMDTYLIIAAALDDSEPPWCEGNDPEFANQMLRLHYPGLKIQEGEVKWQRLHGVRYAPGPPSAEWDGIR